MPARQDQREARPSPDFDPLTPEQRVLIGQMRPWLHQQIGRKTKLIDNRTRLWARNPKNAAQFKREIDELTHDICWMNRILASERGGLLQRVFWPYQQRWEADMAVLEQRRQERVNEIATRRQSEARLNEAMSRLGVEPANTNIGSSTRRRRNNQAKG